MIEPLETGMKECLELLLWDRLYVLRDLDELCKQPLLTHHVGNGVTISSEIRNALASIRLRGSKKRDPRDAILICYRGLSIDIPSALGGFGFARLERNIHLLACCANGKRSE